MFQHDTAFDLSVHDSFAYTGTWGSTERNGNMGNTVKIWSLGPTQCSGPSGLTVR